MAKLTEQDILNWDGPEDDYMNADQLQFFKELLLKLQDELIETHLPPPTIYKSTNLRPIQPIAPPKKKNTPSNCAPATVSANS